MGYYWDFFLVLLMLGGFILLEAGSTRMKNAGHIAGKTIFTAGIGSLVFWAVGYGFIYGDGNWFIGLSNFFSMGIQALVKKDFHQR